MDKKTFEAWELEIFDPDKILEIPYKAMTEEEIAAIRRDKDHSWMREACKKSASSFR